MKKVLKVIQQVFLRIVISLTCLTLFRLKVKGRKNVPKEGTLIFCGNHKSYLDPVAIVLFAPRKLRFMAKEELKNNLLFGYICNVFDTIYVKRDSKDVKPLKEALKTLKDGGCIGIFPEGTRNGMEKNNGEMKDGAAYLALKTSATIIPVGVIGDGKMFHKNKVIFGEPIDITQYVTKDKAQEKENKEIVTELIKQAILKLTNE